MSEKKKSGGALLGAAFLMATSAIGPGFLTQTATFTGQYQESFGFVILVSVILAAIAQLNIWRVLCVTGLRGQDVSNKVLPGLGYLVSILIVFGGLVFNIGNVGGGALGFNTLLGIPTKVGYILAGLLAILVFVLKNAKSARDFAHRALVHFRVVQTVCHGHRKRIHRKPHAQQNAVEKKHKTPFHSVCLLFVDRIPSKNKTRPRARCTSGTG